MSPIRKTNLKLYLCTILMLLTFGSQMDDLSNRFELTCQLGETRFGILREANYLGLGYYKAQSTTPSYKPTIMRNAYHKNRPMLKLTNSRIILPGIRFRAVINSTSKPVFFMLWHPLLTFGITVLWGYHFYRRMQFQKEKPYKSSPFFTSLKHLPKALKIKLWVCTLLMLVAFGNQIDGVRNGFFTIYAFPPSGIGLDRANNEFLFIYVTSNQITEEGWIWKYTQSNNQHYVHVPYKPNYFLPGINYGTHQYGATELRIFAISLYYFTFLSTLLFLYYRWQAWLFLRKRCRKDVCKSCDYDLQGTTDSNNADQQQGKLCPECGAFNAVKV